MAELKARIPIEARDYVVGEGELYAYVLDKGKCATLPEYSKLMEAAW
ncbi:hypothetical protein PC118_g7495 [Phytophthora cactorum]|uniref:Uncharacterized protein n=1 Tax=Phytophthora cactorum TaxID=29920 RepID=A0A8T1DUL7_9STRA|nr:hypothetical protein PC111_g7028 [Phytophthora cactorum]KAG2846384.1 hypothetical protein PC112_g1502 [Phytophthora cactorum]KAG2860063.1 hypothetical protein PC113_g8385 [Phytophthora cactorum]KAG2918073.1 hypothetical protein PC114_g6925 [Phytophthora cactorum]KAG2927839.1 hypothetical protein PC115_g7385 [Phytophthora cactorum]